jgi:hypothetical protein
MLDQFRIDIPAMQRAALLQYCKMENISPAAIVRASEARYGWQFRLKATVFHLLQHIDKRLNAMISRLSAEMEHSSLVQRRLS